MNSKIQQQLETIQRLQREIETKMESITGGGTHELYMTVLMVAINNLWANGVPRDMIRDFTMGHIDTLSERPPGRMQ